MTRKSEMARIRNLKRLSEGLCRCKNPVVPGRNQCQRCVDRDERRRIQNHDLGMCLCGNKRAIGKRCCQKCLNRAKSNGNKRKRIVVNNYGGKCACCGITELSFLCIDHKNNDGNKHRREIGNGDAIYRWAIKNNFPDTLQILCANCHQAKHILGECPHQTQQKALETITNALEGFSYDLSTDKVYDT